MVDVAHSGEVNLLLIEDDVDVADVLARAFREEGHRTTVAYTGQEGLAPRSGAPGRSAPRCRLTENEWNRGVTTDSLGRSGAAGHHCYRARYEEPDRRGAGARGNGSHWEVLCSQEFQRVIGSSREQAPSAGLSGQVQPG